MYVHNTHSIKILSAESFLHAKRQATLNEMLPHTASEALSVMIALLVDS